eukprot:3162997-Rhodomonas_salina.1
MRSRCASRTHRARPGTAPLPVQEQHVQEQHRHRVVHHDVSPDRGPGVFDEGIEEKGLVGDTVGGVEAGH